MLGSIRNFSKTIWAKIILVIIVIPFITWGMGDVFRGGNTNTVAKINKHKISTQNFIDHINSLNLSAEVIRENIDKNIIEEILSDLINKNILSMEAKKLNINLSDTSLSKIIKNDENFMDENKKFSRVKYEKYLIENNMSANSFEYNLKVKETNKILFNYISAGISLPTFMIENTFNHLNKKLTISALPLNLFYKKESDFDESKIEEFIKKNNELFKEEFISFRFSIINPQTLINSTEFNVLFFTKIDEIENLIINNTSYENILDQYKLSFNNIIKVNNNGFDHNGIEQKDKNKKIIDEIFKSKLKDAGVINLIEIENNYALVITDELVNELPSKKSKKFKKKIIQSLINKDIFEYNQRLIAKIKTNSFKEEDFTKLAEEKSIKAENIIIKGINDNGFFSMDSNRQIFDQPKNTFMLTNSNKDENIYLIHIKDFEISKINKNSDEFSRYSYETSVGIKNNIYSSFDNYINQQYKIDINGQTVERLKNYFR